MLVLSREPGEEIIIVLEDGRQIKVAVTATRGNKVHLGFDAPQTVKVHRREVWEDIKAGLPKKQAIDVQKQKEPRQEPRQDGRDATDVSGA